MNKMDKGLYKALHYARKARKHAIVAISELLTNYPNQEYNTHIEGTDLDCYTNLVTKVYKKGRQVRVVTQPEFLAPEFNSGVQGDADDAINVLSDITILSILESMVE